MVGVTGLAAQNRFIELGEQVGLPRAHLERVVELSEELWPIHNPIPRPESRLSLALGFADGEPVVSMLADRGDGPAVSRAEKIKRELSGVKTRLNDRAAAQSFYPTGKAAFSSTADDSLVPGISVGSGSFPCGSLGCFATNNGVDYGVSAAHVINLNASLPDAAWIYAPGRPDVNNIRMKNRIGRLDDSIDLVPVSSTASEEEGQMSTASVDIASFAIEFPKNRERSYSNRVPLGGDNYTNLSGIATLSDGLAIAIGGKKVNKVGRTTGWRSGRIVEYIVLEKTLQLPNRKLYLYTDLFSVLGDDEQRFSDHGDSGAPVYTDDGILIGFVVGAMGNETLCCRAEDSFSELGLELKS